jgi:archaetidylinositol phosphate synthase
MKIDLYALKPASLRLVRPLENACVRFGIGADALSVLSVVVAIVAAGAIVLSPSVPILLLVVPIAAAARLSCNLLDGAVARRTGTQSARGELVNEVTDRLADTAFLAAPIAAAGVSAPLVLAAVVAALIASYVGIATRAAGGPRLYLGILSKPGRMVLVSAGAIAAYLGDDATAWNVALALVAVGAAVTAAHRTMTALRILPGPPER